MRMLDNVIDINYYAVDKARNSNLRHRPVGLGIMGFQDCLHRCACPTPRSEAVEFADRSMEMVAYAAYWASTELAEERGRYAVVPRLAVGPRHPAAGHARHPVAPSAAATSSSTARRRLDWEALRARIKQHGMRNSNCLAIAPTATIANIVGVSASIEPTYQNLFVKSNLSGEFTVVNDYLVADLKRAGLWDEVMIADLKYFDGNLARIDRAPADAAPALRHRVRGRAEVAGRVRGAAPEVDRPVAVAQHLHGGRLGQEAGRDLQARLDPRPEDHLLPARAGRDARREVDRRRPAQLNAVPTGRPPSQPKTVRDRQADCKFCAIDKPDCEAVPRDHPRQPQLRRAVPGAAVVAAEERRPVRGDGAGLAAAHLPCRWISARRPTWPTPGC